MCRGPRFVANHSKLTIILVLVNSIYTLNIFFSTTNQNMFYQEAEFPTHALEMDVNFTNIQYVSLKPKIHTLFVYFFLFYIR